MNAMMKQMLAARRVGSINVPNHPTYKRLSVEVTHSQNWSQVLLRDRVKTEEAISHSKYMCEE